MRRQIWRSLAHLFLAVASARIAAAQQPLTWNEVRERFESNNPNLLAGKLTVEEFRANEVTAGLRPNPEFTFVADQFRVFHPNPLAPFQNTQITPTVSELFERRHKRQLRVESARFATSIAGSDQQDLVRNLIFNLRDAFNRTLQAKSLLELAHDNLTYYDRIIGVNRERLNAGDISRSDFARIELQRVQFQTDLINAQVNVRTAKIALLALMNDRRAVDAIDVTGVFDFTGRILLLDELRHLALASRPDLQAAAEAVNKARSDNRLAHANGSTDPTAGLEYQRTGPDNTLGISVAFPIRVFDRNQGEKTRTAIEIHRVERIRESIESNIGRDVDSGYATLQSTLALLTPYRDKYLPEAREVRDLVQFAYEHGAASLLEFLDAQKSYRDIELNYRNLIGSYLAAANQLNLAVGREVIP